MHIHTWQLTAEFCVEEETDNGKERGEEEEKE